MDSLSRRRFSTLFAAAPLAARAAANSMPVRPLGALGFRAGILGFGAQRIAGTELAVVDRILAEGIEHGLNYVDTAPNYGNSEELVGRALQGRRDQVFLVTKIETATRSEAAAQIRESLRRLRTDHLDCVEFHNLGRDDRFPSLDAVLSKDGALAALLEARRQGQVRHLGLSTHSNVPRILQALDAAPFELVMGVLNFVDRHVYGLEEKLLPEVRRRKLALVAMKALGGPHGPRGAARLAAEDYHGALRYAWDLPGLAVSIVGFRTPEELRQGIAAAKAYQPLTAAESRALAERGRTLAAQWGPTRGPVVS